MDPARLALETIVSAQSRRGWEGCGSRHAGFIGKGANKTRNANSLELLLTVSKISDLIVLVFLLLWTSLNGPDYPLFLNLSDY